MSEKGEKDRFPLTKQVFDGYLENMKKVAKKDGVSSKRLRELTTLVAENEDFDESQLSIEEQNLFVSLIQVKHDIATGVEEGTLSIEEAKKLRRKFGFEKEEKTNGNH